MNKEMVHILDHPLLQHKARKGQTITANELAPVYHRLSQAERERLERENQNP